MSAQHFPGSAVDARSAKLQTRFDIVRWLYLVAQLQVGTRAASVYKFAVGDENGSLTVSKSPVLARAVK